VSPSGEIAHNVGGEPKKPWRAVCEALASEGVHYVFGLPGNPLYLYNDLWDFPQIKPVLVRMETSAVFLAMAYARVSGKVGVLHSSPGPGMANLVPGLLEAYYACSPIVSICSAASRRFEGQGGFQDTPSLDMVRPISRWATRIDLSEKTPWTMRRAFALARGGKPGPVYVELPADVASAEAEMPAYRRGLAPLRTAADPVALEDAAALLSEVERPTIFCGGGVGLSGAERELVALAERLDAPVVTTPCGRGSISERHRLAFGGVGLYRTRSSARPLDEADCVLVVGSRLEELQTGMGRYFPANARVIQIDVDAAEIGRFIEPDVALVGDAKLVLDQLAAAVRRHPGRAWVEELTAFRHDYEQQVEVECALDESDLKTRQVVHALNRVFDEGFVLVHENGGQDLWSYYCPYLKVTEHRGCVAPAEQTVMGLGVAGAIGAKLAAPDKHVVCVTGDGAFQMYLKEIPTALQYGAPVLWVVLNNAALHWVKWIGKATGERYHAVDFDAMPDLVGIARASGAHAERVETPGDVLDALGRAKRALADGVPAVIDCAIDPWDYADGFTEFHREVWGLSLPESRKLGTVAPLSTISGTPTPRQ
jgi:acetolactate synthase I/II/III large subunit